ncbi:unnamed protein product, partial [Prorocentrum cordatum]
MARRRPGRRRTGAACCPRASRSYVCLLFLLFHRKVFDRAERLHYMTSDRRIHVAMLYRLCRRLSDALGSTEMLFDPMEIFEKPWVTWEDMRGVLEGGESKMSVVLTRHPLERVNSVMQGEGDLDNGGSYLGLFWSVFSFIMILTSIAAIMYEGLQGLGLQTAIVVIFTFDYLVKLICSPYVRVALANIDILVEKVVPDSESSELQPRETTKQQRLLSHLLAPMNIVDLASILPLWVDTFGAESGLKLGFLRILRIFRVVRLLKAGTFSETLQVLGETIRRSLNSFVVLVIWILIIATVVGTVLNMMEEENGKCEDPENPDGPKIHCRWTFDSVSTSVYWVIGRLCNMHGSLLAGGQIPKGDASFFLVLFLGILKGCCLVVPVGQIATAFKEADGDFKRAQGITAQIRAENHLPLGTDWVKDRQSPFVSVNLMPADSLASIGVASFNVPLNRSRELSATLDVPVDSRSMRRTFSSVSPCIRVIRESPGPRARTSGAAAPPAPRARSPWRSWGAPASRRPGRAVAGEVPCPRGSPRRGRHAG